MFKEGLKWIVGKDSNLSVWFDKWMNKGHWPTQTLIGLVAPTLGAQLLFLQYFLAAILFLVMPRNNPLCLTLVLNLNIVLLLSLLLSLLGYVPFKSYCMMLYMTLCCD